jgi:hypothetical protein
VEAGGKRRQRNAWNLQSNLFCFLGACLDFLAILVGLLDQGQLGVRVRHRQLAVGRIPGAVQHQGPLFDVAALQNLRVEAHLRKINKIMREISIAIEHFLCCLNLLSSMHLIFHHFGAFGTTTKRVGKQLLVENLKKYFLE